MKLLIKTKKHSSRGKLLTGFTLIELIVVIAIIAILSGFILFSVAQYISKGKDSNIAGSLAVLIPAGEAYYNVGNTYSGFCNSDVVKNAISQMTLPSDTAFNCAEDNINNFQSWVVCAQEFTNTKMAFCVDSRGVKKEINYDDCTGYAMTSFKCR